MSDLLKPLIKEASVKSLKEGNKEITMVLRLILAEFQKEEISQEQINEEDLIKLAKETISDLSANSMKDMGNVMKVLKDKTSGQADPATISKIVKGLLS